ncbi:EamA family transporter [Niallia oryzisoli]|uniref:EamA family transporter n=1 Tax=Niallia oryzisoli TaxID=1737571 RepID=A0ABZ2CCP2_9BACI
MIGEILALIAAFSFGCANVMVKKGVGSNSKNNGAFLSVLITFSLAGIIMLIKGLFQDWSQYTANGIGWFILAGVLTAYIGRTLLFTSIQHLGSVRASTLKRLNSLFTVLIGVLFLHESMNFMVFFGMLLIFASSSFLMYETIISNRRLKNETAAANESKIVKSETENVSKRNWFKRFKLVASLGYMYGVVSALAYSVGYVVRKEGLKEIPDPFFGTMIGALVGILIFIMISLFKKTFQHSIVSTFTQSHPWLIAAGVATSLGQILYFSALTYSNVSRVAIITSTDVIFTLILSAFIFKTHEGITKTVYLAAVIAMVGAGMIVVG